MEIIVLKTLCNIKWNVYAKFVTPVFLITTRVYVHCNENIRQFQWKFKT